MSCMPRCGEDIRKLGVLLLLPPPLSSPWLHPHFPTFCRHIKLIPNFGSLLTAFYQHFSPFLNHQARLSFHPLHVQILPTFKAHGMGPPPPTSSFFPSACWVSLHCGIELSGLYHLTLCKQIQCLVIQGLKKLSFM